MRVWSRTQAKARMDVRGPRLSAVASEAQAREYKLGKAYEPTKQSEEMSQLENKNVAGSTWLDNTSSNENELFSRLNQDPLYAMRQSQKEIGSRKSCRTLSP